MAEEVLTDITRKRGNCECIVTWSPADVAPVLIRSNYNAHAKFEVAQPIRWSTSYSVFIADTLCYAVTLTFGLWPLTLIMYSRLVSPHSNSVPNLSAIDQFSAELLPVEYLTLWPWTCIRIVCRKFKLTQAIRSRSVMITLSILRYGMLWPWPLTPWPWTSDMVSRDETSLYQMWAKSNNPRLSYWSF